VIEFPDMATLKLWYESAEHRPLIDIRHGAGADVPIAADGT
jgi:uncharacterized protein (DUF1330 family)